MQSRIDIDRPSIDVAEEHMDKGRLEAFSDGVLAVAITLLALNLVVDGPGHGSLAGQLASHWPSFLAYALSFLTIGIIWVNHHGLIRGIAQVDRPLLFLNLLLLLFVVLIPFSTALMAGYLSVGGWDSHVATAVYAGVFEMMGLSFGAMFNWSMPRSTPLRARLRFSIGAFAYVPALIVAFVSPLSALVIIGLVALYYIPDHTPRG
ncbi:MAG: TMEM175 family protein [Candidatus Dormibacteria bacterium]